MKFVVRDHHLVSLGGYIVERNFPYRNIIVVNKTDEPIKIEVPVFKEEWIEEHRNLGLKIIPVSDEENFLTLFKKAKLELEKSNN
ncbi:MAG: energy-converting hydrogenase B subunit P [Methanobrevibacter sp.]|nr:energy-converting hydrogenase B subunit P [Candidatus Methanovirga procula]